MHQVPKKRNYARWRLYTLVGIHLLFIAHFIHWKLKGRTLAPLEFNEVLYTIHQGIVTAGFILMAVVMLATLVFGRFFCSWGCHILALQDAAGWIMDKLRIKRQPIRSRTLIWLPVAVMFYLFIWPQIAQLFQGTEAQAMHVVEAGGSKWSSFTTDNMWRNLPAPGVAALTFFICGFVIVYLLGSRGFCFQACPYGALFGIADQVAPGRIVLAKDCSQCGLCTKACTSDILVHRELAMHGMVTNPRCLKDMDCVTACPENAVQYGFRMPPLFRKGHPMGAYSGRYSFSLGEDLFMLGFFPVGLMVYRALYDSVPFLLAVALSILTAYMLVLGYRMLRKSSVQLRGTLLKIDRRLRPAGVALLSTTAVLLLFFLHSAFIQYHAISGQRLFARIAEQPDHSLEAAPGIIAAVKHYERALSAGLIEPVDRRQELASLYLLRGSEGQAEQLLRSIAAEHPDHIEAGYQLGMLAKARGDMMLAAQHWQSVLANGELQPRGRDDELLARTAMEFGAVKESAGDLHGALRSYRSGLDRVKDDVRLLLGKGAVESRLGLTNDAIASYEAALHAGEGSAVLHNNLGALYLKKGRPEKALPHFLRLAELLPNDGRARYTLGVLQARLGRPDLAREQLNMARLLDPASTNAAMALAALDHPASQPQHRTPQ